MACIGLYTSQESIIFPAQTANKTTYQNLESNCPNSSWQFLTKDKTNLQGWLVDDNHEKPIYLYYGGNAEDVAYTFESFHNTINRSLLAVNFRGYGRSAGNPSEKKLFSDALEIFDAIQEKYKGRSIGLIGRSLGSGVACYVASQRPIKNLILITPYDSLKAVAQTKYPIMPISILLKHPFDSYLNSEKISAPTLFLLAQFDYVIPNDNSMNLFNHWPSKKYIQTIQNATHNNIIDMPDLKMYINEFLLKNE